MPSSKIGVIIGHEYLTRVRAKWFLLTTLLGPIGMIAVFAIPALMTIFAGDGRTGKVAILDESGTMAARIVASDTAAFVVADAPVETLRQRVLDEELQAWVVIPANVVDSGKVTMYSRGGSGLAFDKEIESAIEPFVVEARLQRAGVDTSVIDLVESGVNLRALKVTEGGIENDASTASAILGYVAGFAIYLLIFLYGTMVMRGVVEEKANRIVEIIASSVRPWDIMMGKVIGIGLVGLTQVTAWAVLGSAVASIAGTLVAPNMNIPPEAQAAMADGGFAIPSISFVDIGMTIFYFLAGYFLYATLFAAIGSAVDQEADANQLTFPVTIPVVLTMMFIGNVVADPNGTLSVVLSLFPLFSPILMTVRVAATDVPWWQILTSVVLTITMFFGCVWLAARIYRIGILSYGKKPSIKEIIRWTRLNV